MSVIETHQPDIQAQIQLHPEAVRPRHRWTVEEYQKMGEVGLLTEDSRVELIEGDIIEMAPIGSNHAGHVNHLVGILWRQLYGKAVVAGQNPVVLNDRSETQPDIAVLRWRDDFYRTTHPMPADVFLLIEVADTTARYDREVKIPLYARNGIPEAWLLDLRQRYLEVYRQPQQGQYRQVTEHRVGWISPASCADVMINLAELLPGPG